MSDDVRAAVERTLQRHQVSEERAPWVTQSRLVDELVRAVTRDEPVDFVAGGRAAGKTALSLEAAQAMGDEVSTIPLKPWDELVASAAPQPAPYRAPEPGLGRIILEVELVEQVETDHEASYTASWPEVGNVTVLMHTLSDLGLRLLEFAGDDLDGSDVLQAIRGIAGEPYDATGKSEEQIDHELGYLSENERSLLSDQQRNSL